MALLRHGSTIPSQRRVELEKVVQTYYGKDDISLDDLHSVLLLDMGPQEHRRLLKGGFYNGEAAAARPLGVLNQDEIWKECPRNQADTSVSSQEVEEFSSMATSEEPVSKTVSVNECQPAEIDLENGHNTENRRDEEDLAHQLEEKADDGYVMETQLGRRRNSRHKARRYESLLGHGVHGRRVVDIFMEPEGNQEILNFCQRWRRVFVDATHPAFLPLGWDISHSGRREFGDFSIFKTQEKVE